MTRQDDMLRTAKEVQLGNYAPAPFVLTHGRGRRVTDAAGREYLDLSGGISVLSVGHSHPTLAAAIGEQAARLMHVSNIFYNDRAIEFAEAICARTPFDRVYFCNSGSEANESLLKLARRYHHDRGDEKRVEFVSTFNSFHGRTMGALSLTGQTKYHKGMEPLVEGVSFIDFNDLAALDATVTDRTAAVIFEPVQAEGGIVVATDEFVKGARRICDERGALLFFDEIQTGYGRTGRFLAQEWFDVVPDACSLAKGIGGGFPLGAILAKEEAARGMTAGLHGTTYGGNQLATTVGNAVMDVMLSDGFLDNVHAMGESLYGRLQAIVKMFPEVFKSVRGAGLMLGLECVVPGGEMVSKLREAGLLTVPAAENVVRILPPLIIEQAHIGEAAAIIEQVAAAWVVNK